MSPSWLIVADDLTGAADCAVAFAKSNIPASVVWDGEWAETPAVSINVESRSLSAQQAADLHASLKPDLVLLNIRLPIRDGWDVLGELRRRGETPVIMVSDLDLSTNKLQALRVRSAWVHRPRWRRRSCALQKP